MSKDTSKNSGDIVSSIGAVFTIYVNQTKDWLTFKYDNHVLPHLPFIYHPDVLFFQQEFSYHDRNIHTGEVYP